MDRIEELETFVRIIDEGGLARAAHRLRRSPQAVTRALAALEDRIGLRLIDRTTRRFAVTEAGVALAEQARGILRDYAVATTRGTAAPMRGLVRVTAPVQFGRLHVAPVVVAFLDQFPEARVELLLHDRNIDLFDEAIDAAVRIGPLQNSGLTARRLGEVRRQWLASPAYLALRGTPRTPADLVLHETLQGAGPGMPEWTFGRSRRAPAGSYAARFRVNDIETQLTAARDGRGIARLLSYQVAGDVTRGALVVVLAEFEPPPLPVHLLAKGRAHRAPATEAFLDLAAQRLSRLPVIQPMR